MQRWFVLDVNPEPWAVGPVGYARRSGKMSAYVGRNAQLEAFKEAVREALGDGHEKIVGRVALQFFFWRNRADYKTPQARTHRKHEADVTNLQKSTEDALQGILFENDKDTNDIRSVLVEQGPDVPGRIVLSIEKSPDFPKVMEGFPQSVCELLDSMDGVATPSLFDEPDEYTTTEQDLF